MDALARVGEAVTQEIAGQTVHKDTSRKNTKLPKQLAAMVALRAQGYDNTEIAERLGVTKQKLTVLLVKARKLYGWSDLGDKLAHVAVPQAIDNIVKHVEFEGSDKAVSAGMHAMTRELARGVGILKNHTAVKQESKSEDTRTLRVEVILPQGGVLPVGPIEGVFSTPRRPALPEAVIEAEVVK